MIRSLLLSLLAASAARADGFAFISSQEAGTVAVIDLATTAVACVAEIGGRPAAIAVDRAAGLAYAVATETGEVVAITPACATHPVVRLDGGPFGIAVNPVRGVIYVGDWYGARLFEIDPAARRVLRSLPVGTAPGGIAVTPDGGTVISADRDDNRVSLVDAETGQTRARISVGGHPFGVTVHDGRLFTADVEADSVSVIDLAAATVIATIPVGKRPYAIAFAAGRGFVTDQYADTVTVFDADSLQPVATLDTGLYPEGIAATPDGQVLVANWSSNTVTLIDAASLAVVAEIEVPDGPRAFGDFILP